MKSVKLYDANGRMLTAWNNPFTELEIDFTGLAAGNYYLTFQGETAGLVKKVVKI